MDAEGGEVTGHVPCNHCRLATSETELENVTMDILHAGNGLFDLKLSHWGARRLAQVALGIVAPPYYEERKIREMNDGR